MRKIIDFATSHPILFIICVIVSIAMLYFFWKGVVAIVFLLLFIETIIFVISGIQASGHTKTTKLILTVLVVVFLIYALYSVYTHLGILKSMPPYCQYGDIDGDGIVDRDDYMLYPPNATLTMAWYQKERADVDNDGDYDIDDWYLIYGYVEGMVDTFPVANSSSSSYQADEPPYFSSYYTTPDEVLTGQNFYLYFNINESNGETLVYRIAIKKGNAWILETFRNKTEPGEWNSFQYVFDSPGTYIVFINYTYLFWSNHENEYPRWWYYTVNVDVKAGYPVANFTYYVEGNTVHFMDLSYDTNGYIVNWTWDFGDGEKSYEQNPVHEYRKAGEYTVTLTITDNEGLTATASKSVKVGGGMGWLCYMLGGAGIVGVAVAVVRWRRKR